MINRRRELPHFGGKAPTALLASRAAVERERVSPELVLVDPELARAERARLEERVRLEELTDVRALRRAVQSQEVPPQDADFRRSRLREVVDFSRTRLAPAVLMASLFVNGVLVADLVAGDGKHSTLQQAPVALRVGTFRESSSPSTITPATPPPASSAAAGASKTPKSRAARSTSKRAAPLRVTKSFVERKLILLVLSAPARKLPHQFVDERTGLVKNNVQVVCRRTGVSSFLCVIRRPGRPSDEGLYVSYARRAKGRGIFTWHGYKGGS
jgi:hypothetical protein